MVDNNTWQTYTDQMAMLDGRTEAPKPGVPGDVNVAGSAPWLWVAIGIAALAGLIYLLQKL